MNPRQQLIEQIRQQSIQARAQALREAAQRQFSNAPVAGASSSGGRRPVEPGCLPLGGVMLIADFFGAYTKTLLTESGTLNGQSQYLALLSIEGNSQQFGRISWTGSEWAIGQVFISDGDYNEFNFAFSPTLFSSAWQSEGPVPFVTSPGEEFDCSWRHCFSFNGEFTIGLVPAWIDVPLTEAPNAYISVGVGETNILWDEQGLNWIIEGPDEGNLSLLPGGTREQLPIGQFAIFDDIVLTISSGICTFAPPVPPLPPPILQGFIFRVDTTEGNGNASLQIPTNSDYVYDYTVNWTSVSDPSVTGTVSGLTGNTTIGFPSGGQYDIRITGIFPAIRFGDKFSDAAKLIRIEQWGNGAWTSMQRAFANCNNLSSYPPKDIPNLSGVNSMQGMFAGASLSFANLDEWDVSNVTDMSSMFLNAGAFNADLSSWNVSQVTSMSQMFEGCSAFNADISGWDVSGVTNMKLMFSGAASFNGDISGWDVSGVTDMSGMFQNATSFNRDLSGWCVSLIPSAPGSFDTGATAWVLPRPNWSTCPP